jgi:hypothetical protein
VIYVSAGIKGEIPNIAKLAAKRGAPTLCGSRDQIKEGLAVGVVEKDGKPAMILNIKAMKMIGMNIDAKLLRLAEVVSFPK